MEQGTAVSGHRILYVDANAKINLFLDVTGRRSDGYHEILTVMQEIDLHDRVTLDLMPAPRSGISVRVCGRYRVPGGEGNLAYRAAHLFAEACGRPMRLHITLEKNIPIAAGLAGGSADAAAVLRGLNLLCGEPLSQERLLALAAEIGSDVPFCLMGGSMLCRGRGERMEPLRMRAALPIVVAMGGERMSTPAAYRALDDRFGGFSDAELHSGAAQQAALIAAMAAGETEGVADNLFNLFETVVLPQCPKAAALKERLLSCGALAALMSGSGPSVYGIFPSRAAAQDAARMLGGEAFASVAVLR